MRIRILPLVLLVSTVSQSFCPSKLIKQPQVVASEVEVKNIEVPEEEFSTLELYQQFERKNDSLPSLDSFTYGIKGYKKLLKERKIENQVLTIVDFSLSSSKKRLWVLDMKNQNVMFNTIVAHGRNTGREYAKHFSNVVDSNQSSLGFYVTGETYYGKNGLSLFLDGQEPGINSNARKRYVVFHGAPYANPDFVKKNGVLGRSLGCPAVPTKLNVPIIKEIKNKSCLFIYYPSKGYETQSELI